VVLPHYLVILYEESCLLVSWCAGDRYGMTGSNEDHDRNRRPGVEDRGWSSTGRVLSDRMIRRSGDTVCGLHHAQGDEVREFLSLTSKPRSTGFPVGAPKPTATIWWFWPQNHRDGFLICVSKPNRLQFIIYAIKPTEDEDDVGHTLRSSSLLWLEASRARVSRSGLKTGEGAVRMMHVASSRRSHGDEAEDGWVDMTRCVGPLYPNFDVFVVLGPMSIWVF
jgi:hypothetical protein